MIVAARSRILEHPAVCISPDAETKTQMTRDPGDEGLSSFGWNLTKRITVQVMIYLRVFKVVKIVAKLLPPHQK